MHPIGQRKSARCIPLCSAAWLSGWLATQTGNCLCKRWRTAGYCACRRCRVSCALRTVEAATPCSCSRGARALVGKSTSASCAARALLDHARENAAAADTVGSVRTGSQGLGPLPDRIRLPAQCVHLRKNQGACMSGVLLRPRTETPEASAGELWRYTEISPRLDSHSLTLISARLATSTTAKRRSRPPSLPRSPMLPAAKP